MPPALRTPRVVTIHDLAFLTNPECALPSLAEYLTKVVPRSCAAPIASSPSRNAPPTISSSGCSAARADTGDPPGRWTLSHARDVDAEVALRGRLGFSHPFIWPSAPSSRARTTSGLIAAFARHSRQPGGPPMLVIAGRKGWLYEGRLRGGGDFDVRDRVRFLDFIADADLPTLYRRATALAMPSIYEGFGIPVVEAMASGTPVICSDAGRCQRWRATPR